MACGAFSSPSIPPYSLDTAVETAALPPCPHLNPPQVAGGARRGRVEAAPPLDFVLDDAAGRGQHADCLLRRR